MKTLSIVVAARNDDYGGNFLGRVQLFVDNLALLCADREDLELIVVEWNPPMDRQGMREAIEWPGELIPIRIITVPPAVHQTLAGEIEMPMLEYWAKNVGIRRAAGRFVLATNPDIIFSPEMISRLLRLEDSPNTFYRANRHDVPRAACEGKHLNLWAYCAANTYAICQRSPEATPRDLHTDASGDFMMMERSAWVGLRGYPEVVSHGVLDSLGVMLANREGMVQVVLSEPIYHIDHDRSQCVGRPSAQWQLGEKNGPDWGLAELSLDESIWF